MLEIDLLEISYYINDVEFPSFCYYRPACLESHGVHIAEREKNLAYRIDLLWYIEKDINDVCSALFLTRRYLVYLYKNDALKIPIITYAFNPEKSIIQILRNTIAFIIEVEDKLPFAKEIMPNMHHARKILNKFEDHKHYLPNRSSNQNKHLIINILLYIQYVYDLVNTVHEQALKSLESYEEDHRDLMPRHELLAKDAYKNRFRPMIIRCRRTR